MPVAGYHAGPIREESLQLLAVTPCCSMIRSLQELMMGLEPAAWNDLGAFRMSWQISHRLMFNTGSCRSHKDVPMSDPTNYKDPVNSCSELADVAFT